MEGEREPDEKQNGGNLIGYLRTIIDRSNTEVDRVYKIYRILAGAVTTILIVGIGTVSYVSYNSVRDMRADLREEMSTFRTRTAQEMTDFKERTSEEFDLLKNHVKSEQEIIVADIGKKVNQRIGDEFNKDNIQALVNTKAAERIDKVADPVIESKIDKRISPVIAGANKTLKSVEVDAAKMHNTVAQLELFNEFIMTTTAAQNDDRAAFEQLRKWATDKSYPLSSRAQESLAAIMDRFDVVFLAASGPPIPWGAGVDPAKLTITDLETIYESASSRNTRSQIAYYIDQRADISKKDKLGFFFKMLIKEKSMDAYDALLRLFERQSGQKFNRFDTNSVVEWWNGNRDTIK